MSFALSLPVCSFSSPHVFLFCFLSLELSFQIGNAVPEHAMPRRRWEACSSLPVPVLSPSIVSIFLAVVQMVWCGRLRSPNFFKLHWRHAAKVWRPATRCPPMFLGLCWLIFSRPGRLRTFLEALSQKHRLFLTWPMCFVCCICRACLEILARSMSKFACRPGFLLEGTLESKVIGVWGQSRPNLLLGSSLTCFLTLALTLRWNPRVRAQGIVELDASWRGLRMRENEIVASLWGSCMLSAALDLSRWRILHQALSKCASL